MKTYIKQLIDNSGNNLIPVSGTSSCYNSEGLNVDQLIENLKNTLITSITWSELQNLKNSSKLSPGIIYLISDYETVTSQPGTSATGTKMPILVQAISNNTLLEDGIAIGGSSGSGLIEVKYCLDNDGTRFSWADESGFGVIYWMRDANNNQAPYDFKNILFNEHYTFDLNGNDFSGSCYNNTIQSAYEDGKQVLNRVTFQNTNASDSCSRNFIDGGTRDTNYGPGTSDTDTRYILGEY